MQFLSSIAKTCERSSGRKVKGYERVDDRSDDDNNDRFLSLSCDVADLRLNS